MKWHIECVINYWGFSHANEKFTRTSTAIAKAEAAAMAALNQFWTMHSVHRSSKQLVRSLAPCLNGSLNIFPSMHYFKLETSLNQLTESSTFVRLTTISIHTNQVEAYTQNTHINKFVCTMHTWTVVYAGFGIEYIFWHVRWSHVCGKFETFTRLYLPRSHLSTVHYVIRKWNSLCWNTHFPLF